MNRRKSTFESLKLSSRDNTRSLDDAASDAESHSSFLQLADTYSERMRTTAIMLSQLYKSRFPEKHSAADQNIQNSEKAAPRPTTLGYAKSFVSLLSQKAHLTSRSPHDPSGAQSPQKITKDKQLPKSMKANFDSVRDRLLNEMATLEQQRVEALERANSSYREAHSGIIVDNISEFPDASAPPAGTDDSIPKPNSAAASDHNG